jgi:ornithine carbamoyltransferase
MRGFVSLLDYSTEELTAILDRADYLREAWRSGAMPRSLEGQALGLWFHGQGFRNRVAFELGARAMGGEVAFMPGELGVQEPLEDIGGYLQNWFTMLVVRAARRADLLYLADHCSIPVIDARTELSHPCEIMGDLQFLRRHRGRLGLGLEGLRVAFVGETTNLCLSWFEAAVRFPIELVQIAPEGYAAEPALVASLNAEALGSIRTSSDMGELDASVGLLYTDCWPARKNEEEAAEIREAFSPYSIGEAELARLGEGAAFLPCPPVTRGEEVSAEAMASPLCMDLEAKDDLLHAQNAIMEAVAARSGAGRAR